MDFSQEGDDEHQGSRNFLLTQHPTLIEDNLVLLQNVVEKLHLAHRIIRCMEKSSGGLKKECL